MRFVNLFVFLFGLIFFSNSSAKRYESHSFTCADEIGPLVEFKIPNFNVNNEEKILVRIYKKEDRSIVTTKSGRIKRATSPIDDSYNFYIVSYLKNGLKIDRFIEFFPPSHLLIRKQENQYESLICWIPE